MTKVYSLGTFISNGGEFYLTADADCDIYDINIVISRINTSNGG